MLEKILVPLDGSKNSLRGLKFASDVAIQSGSSIIGLNVNSFPEVLKDSPTLLRKTKQKSEDIIKQAKTASQKLSVPFTGIIKDNNNVGKTIVTFAENNKIDMIIMGSRGPDPEFEMFLGSIANFVINKSKIPVTIVK